MPTMKEAKIKNKKFKKDALCYVQVEVGVPVKSAVAEGKGSTEPEPGRAET